ncbi:MAG: hypothetical protein OER98_08685 [Gammaproteobacteria bacterium]|nr:hypothetical protein [Gammaproteobacteria bacterium]
MKLNTLVLAGAIALPVQYGSDWQLLKYSRLEANEVNFSRQGMAVKVDQSASPIIYPFDSPKTVTRVEVSGNLSNLLDLPSTQGQKGSDDFSLKIGLVISGDKTLNAFQRLFSAKWIRKLFDLAPEGTGVEKIYFLNAVQDESLLGRQRQHPQSELIFENNVWLLDESGDFSLIHDLQDPQQVIAIWLSIDGDDTRSSYTTTIKSLLLKGSFDA